MEKKVFILGDSRTGTTSIHGLLLALNFKSIHYYIEESGTQTPHHDFVESNWKLLKKFYDSSGYNAFSDYPTRTVWRKIYEAYPEAFYILSVRQSPDVWKKSAADYFTKCGIKVDIERWLRSHIRINAAIEDHFSQAKGANFLKITIDDGSDNGLKIKSFLGIKSEAKLRNLNAASPGKTNETRKWYEKMWSLT